MSEVGWASRDPVEGGAVGLHRAWGATLSPWGPPPLWAGLQVQSATKRGNWQSLAHPLSYLFSLSVVSKSLRPHGLQPARPPCPSPSPWVCSNSHPQLNQWCHLTISSCRLLLLLPSISPSLRIFSNMSALRNRWPNYWSFNFSMSPSNEHSGLISFRIDWFDLLTGQGPLKSLLQHHSLVRRTLLQEDSLHPAWGTGSLHIKTTH